MSPGIYQDIGGGSSQVFIFLGRSPLSAAVYFTPFRLDYRIFWRGARTHLTPWSIRLHLVAQESTQVFARPIDKYRNTNKGIQLWKQEIQKNKQI